MKTILHCDANNFYASVECILNKDLQGKCVAVSGNYDKRHGIILAKNEQAKKYGISTGEVIWQALKKCPQLVLVPPQFDKYVEYSNRLFDIYCQYTDRVEPYGIDECWLDVSESINLFGSGEKIANTLRERIKKELGITISVGVSYNKIFAKIGSDIKKPDATTVINIDNYKTKVWSLPVSNLLMIGKKTTTELQKIGITTIGDLANSNVKVLETKFGINGLKNHEHANGLCQDQVRYCYDTHIPKSIGNSTTMPENISNIKQATAVIMALSEMVAIRLRRFDFVANGVSLGLKTDQLKSVSKQKKLDIATNNASKICSELMPLYNELYEDLARPIRAISVGTYDLTNSDNQVEQLCMFESLQSKDKSSQLDKSIDQLRQKYGYTILQSASILGNNKLCQDLVDDDFKPFKK